MQLIQHWFLKNGGLRCFEAQRYKIVPGELVFNILQTSPRRCLNQCPIQLLWSPTNKITSVTNKNSANIYFVEKNKINFKEAKHTREAKANKAWVKILSVRFIKLSHNLQQGTLGQGIQAANGATGTHVRQQPQLLLAPSGYFLISPSGCRLVRVLQF